MGSEHGHTLSSPSRISSRTMLLRTPQLHQLLHDALDPSVPITKVHPLATFAQLPGLLPRQTLSDV